MQRGYLGQTRSQAFQSVSFSCPQTLLRVNTSLQLATVNLALGQKLRVRLAQLCVPRLVARYAGYYVGLSGKRVYLEERQVTRRGAWAWGRTYRAREVVTHPTTGRTFICLESNNFIDPDPTAAVLRAPLPFDAGEVALIHALQASVQLAQSNGCNMTPLDVTPPDYAGPLTGLSQTPRATAPYVMRPFQPQTSLVYWAEFFDAQQLVNSALAPTAVTVHAESRVTHSPGGRPLFCLRGGLEGAATTDPRLYADFTAPGLYSFYVVNNTLYADCEVVVTGVARVFDA